MSDSVAAIWDRLVYEPQASAPLRADSTASGAEKPRRKTRSVRVRVLDFTGVLIWGYIAARTFVGDVDRWLADAVAPGLAWLLDYRFFLLLLLGSIFLVLFRRRYWWMPLYVLAYPMIVLLWKFPRLLVRRRSMNLLIGAVHVTTALVSGLERTFVAVTVLAFSALAVALDSPDAVLVLAAVGTLGVWFLALSFAVRYAFAPGRFVQRQRRIIQRFLDSDSFWRTVRVPDAARASSGGNFTPQLSQQVVQAAGFGFIAYRVSHFWAAKLDNYRKGPASVAFSALTVAGLLVFAAFIFALVNMAVYKIAPEQYSTRNATGFLIFVQYAIASMYAGETASVAVAGSWSAAVAILSVVSASIIVLSVVASVVFGYRNTRSDEGASREIAQLRKVGSEFADRLAADYEVTVEELAVHLRAVGFDVLGVMAWLARNDGDWGL